MQTEGIDWAPGCAVAFSTQTTISHREVSQWQLGRRKPGRTDLSLPVFISDLPSDSVSVVPGLYDVHVTLTALCRWFTADIRVMLCGRSLIKTFLKVCLQGAASLPRRNSLEWFLKGISVSWCFKCRLLWDKHPFLMGGKKECLAWKWINVKILNVKSPNSSSD